MHRMFLTERTLYVILVDDWSEQRDEQAKYWLSSVRSFAGEAPVILALNKMDENPNAFIDKTAMRKKYGAAQRRVVRMSAKNDTELELRHYVILRPDWITNALYTITFNRPDDLKNGILTHRDIFALLNNAAHRVKTDEVYNYSDLDYILRVARKFHLSYLVSREREFFPSLCDQNTMNVMEEYAADPGGTGISHHLRASARQCAPQADG